ncbi:TPA: hypothetical protein I8271_003609 [Kluyvera intermedia]|uniref:Uncharacterized protein n=1 Tax=Kluyvera intermedia TaxID=61648 RepID=A0A9P3TB05_KLUIN|nr:hypothetical protein [Phytobacter ursingii]HAT2205127.1 hypothetical protein [Kluyvera intermedia]HAT2208253.1 hypothetical protein [Kluyvera intermedia]HAT2515782.1 hypothetical protein [Kluyvera intermedia]HAT2518957.1 hypothetical protein [Kluyvera intermedia]HAT2603538.1 hypothetical protein [Kluyvera intermedia]
MKKILLVVLGLLAGNVYADDDGSPEMKAEAKALIQAAINYPRKALRLTKSGSKPLLP